VIRHQRQSNFCLERKRQSATGTILSEGRFSNSESIHAPSTLESLVSPLGFEPRIHEPFRLARFSSQILIQNYINQYLEGECSLGKFALNLSLRPRSTLLSRAAKLRREDEASEDTLEGLLFEFKQEAVRLVESGQRVSEAARRLGVAEQRLSNWARCIVRARSGHLVQAILVTQRIQNGRWKGQKPWSGCYRSLGGARFPWIGSFEKA
jgi:hypothetical protein